MVARFSYAQSSFHMAIDYLGYLAGLLTTISFLPQVIRIYRTKSGRDVSLWMVLLMATGVSCWLIYGLLIHSLPIIFTNTVTLVLVLAILVLKRLYAAAH